MKKLRAALLFMLEGAELLAILTVFVLDFLRLQVQDSGYATRHPDG